MAEPQGMYITPEQLQSILKEAVAAAIGAAKQMNPLEQKQYDEQIKRENSKRVFKETVAAEQQKMANRKLNCTHKRWPANAGKMAGHMAPKGQGEWRTGAQLHSGGFASVTCLQCTSTWIFKPFPNEVEYIIDGGGSNMEPPDKSRCLNPDQLTA